MSLVIAGLGPAARAQTSARLAAQFNAIFSPAVSARRQPGLAVLIRHDGRTLFKRAYGMRDLRCDLPNTPATNFRLASCTKQFTAMAIMLLAHDGKLRYDEPLTEIFPRFPAYGRTITIRNLLDHTSGLQSYGAWMSKKYAGKDWEDIPQITDARILALEERQTGTLFPSGTRWQYSNGGFCLLAMIVAKVSGMPFPEFLRRRVFAPLGMRHSAAHVSGRDRVFQRAYGYTLDHGVWLETDQDPTSATLGDGGVYSSLDDLAKWDHALRRHTLLSAAAYRPAITPQAAIPAAAAAASDVPPVGSDGGRLAYGFGWFLDAYRGHRRMWHYGSTIGFNSLIARYPGRKLTIIMLANRTDLSLPALANRAADLVFSKSK